MLQTMGVIPLSSNPEMHLTELPLRHRPVARPAATSIEEEPAEVELLEEHHPFAFISLPYRNRGGPVTRSESQEPTHD